MLLRQIACYLACSVKMKLMIDFFINNYMMVKVTIAPIEIHQTLIKLNMDIFTKDAIIQKAMIMY